MGRKYHEIVRAVIEHQGHFLLARAKGAGHTFLPGGHTEPFEKLTDTLRRELLEEAGINATHLDYLGVMENEFVEAGILHVERCQIFRAYCPKLQHAEPVLSLEPHLEFLWASPAEFNRFNLLPQPLHDLLSTHHAYRAWYSEG